MSNWISVKDRLPDDKVPVLAKVKYDDTALIAYISERSWMENYEYIDVVGNAYISNEICIVHGAKYTQVTHWLPLPKPPKE